MAGSAAGKTFSQIWLRDAATYPLFGVMGVAIGVLGYASYRKLATQNDFCVNKSNPAAFFKETQGKLPWRESKSYKDPFGLYTPMPSAKLWGPGEYQ
mmetsp:Transcript_44431/g.72348  ORF Transcript_44431/g.72348 Transcript_44431/m.72348 type:complete len:97 (-) Transcript_44431:339-629(-)|eukprot:CAMPEP_0184646340 /NCGR_PEP_ID=MMETSP0308-20130426/3037_1 /TAXON_ID=38269 /ORGANISM="Gloeochaete witrockiana, Strain SAG 46.84" /LENGTH=96 /DNA_ID=CAMNT_0027076271 /DNA_START=175 /DNA_END=465 /DNA_ORIENTATION=-